MSDRNPDEDDGPAFPMPIQIAGMIWLLLCAVGVVGAVVTAVSTLWLPVRNSGVGCGVGCIATFSSGFLIVGDATLRGRPRDTLGYGIGSISLSLFFLGLAGLVTYDVLIDPRGGRLAQGTLLGLAAPLTGFGFLLLLAGVLAMSGRSRYLAWRAAHRPNPDG